LRSGVEVVLKHVRSRVKDHLVHLDGTPLARLVFGVRIFDQPPEESAATAVPGRFIGIRLAADTSPT
jgi:hypothetical protein